MTSHHQVANRLCKPENQLDQPLKGTNMEFQPSQGDKPARVVGYGWAVYAVRIDDTVLIDWSWRGYSHSTTKHLTILERTARRSDHVNLAYVRGLWSDPSMKLGKIGGGLGKTEKDILEASPWGRPELPELGPVSARPLSHMPDLPEGWEAGTGERSGPHSYTRWYYGPDGHQVEVYSDGRDSDYKHTSILLKEVTEDHHDTVMSSRHDSMQAAYLKALKYMEEVTE